MRAKKAKILFNCPGLLPFAVLSNKNKPTGIRTQAAIENLNITDKTLQSNVSASTVVLAALVSRKK
ncbi:hypothetical protein NIES4101_85330 [Calothrix sp. NIES-4101]|nr:hypothetical protein NIES4101_85330 [Calothrix sp. NIES-4101]